MADGPGLLGLPGGYYTMDWRQPLPTKGFGPTPSTGSFIELEPATGVFELEDGTGFIQLEA